VRRRLAAALPAVKRGVVESGHGESGIASVASQISDDRPAVNNRALIKEEK
jgi:hypothetical protein